MRRLTHEKIAQDQHEYASTKNHVILLRKRYRKTWGLGLSALARFFCLNGYCSFPRCGDNYLPCDFRTRKITISIQPVKTCRVKFTAENCCYTLFNIVLTKEPANAGSFHSSFGYSRNGSEALQRLHVICAFESFRIRNRPLAH